MDNIKSSNTNMDQYAPWSLLVIDGHCPHRSLPNVHRERALRVRPFLFFGRLHVLDLSFGALLLILRIHLGADHSVDGCSRACERLPCFAPLGNGVDVAVLEEI
jgi:hypothetical protein